MDEPLSRYESLCARFLEMPGVTIGRALSNSGLMVGGKLFAFLRRERLVVKLPAARLAELVLTGAGEPARMGARTMKEWLDLEGHSDWLGLATEAYDYVG